MKINSNINYGLYINYLVYTVTVFISSFLFFLLFRTENTLILSLAYTFVICVLPFVYYHYWINDYNWGWITTIKHRTDSRAIDDDFVDLIKKIVIYTKKFNLKNIFDFTSFFKPKKTDDSNSKFRKIENIVFGYIGQDSNTYLVTHTEEGVVYITYEAHLKKPVPPIPGDKFKAVAIWCGESNDTVIKNGLKAKGDTIFRGANNSKKRKLSDSELERYKNTKFHIEF